MIPVPVSETFLPETVVVAVPSEAAETVTEGLEAEDIGTTVHSGS